jgi:hypothetical protein
MEGSGRTLLMLAENREQVLCWVEGVFEHGRRFILRGDIWINIDFEDPLEKYYFF